MSRLTPIGPGDPPEPTDTGRRRDPDRVTFYRWICPICDGKPSEIGCVHCHGIGITNDVGGWEAHELREVRRPPGVMKSPCADCAYRPGSPEIENYANIPDDDTRPFFCHWGAEVIEGHYTYPAMTAGGVPVGAMVCAGWWDTCLTRAGRPERRYREPRGHASE